MAQRGPAAAGDEFALNRGVEVQQITANRRVRAPHHPPGGGAVEPPLVRDAPSERSVSSLYVHFAGIQNLLRIRGLAAKGVREFSCC